MRAETIYALASAPGRAGVAVVRISGPRAAEALRGLGVPRLPPPRTATRARFRDPRAGEAFDDGLCLWFPRPKSFTGEDVAELHLHGGRAVVAAVTAALAGLPGLRLAEPGEFARRAFENGKLDLTAAEGLADLVNAETAAQRRQSLRQLDGALGRLYDGWRDRLVRALAHIEADIDFPDEDLPGGVAVAATETLASLRTEIAAHLADDRRGERLRDGLSVAIVGAPNAGKSSIFNALSRRDVAIVTPVAGTTRDVIEVHLDLDGYPVTLADTAGLRDSADAVEAEGVRRARARAAAADLRLAVFDATRAPDPHTLALVDADTVVALNKIDLRRPARPVRIGDRDAVPVSAATGEGIAALIQCLSRQAAERLATGNAPALTRSRHREALTDCAAALARAAEAPAAELAAEDVRLAARALGRITGRVGVEDVLDVVFRDFCIGK
jgi:tRNA modification GTPase